MIPGPLMAYTCLDCNRTTFNPTDVAEGFCGACKTFTKARPDQFPPVWGVFAHTPDYPNHFVVRVSWGLWCEHRVALFERLDEARQHILDEGGCVCIARSDVDIPALLECWV